MPSHLKDPLAMDADILAIVTHVGEIVHIVSGVFRLDQHDAHSGRRHDEMGFNALYLL